MATFEVCKDKDYPEHAKKITGTRDIEAAVESAAESFCQEDAEYSDFECYARESGEAVWREFYVTVESRPVFHASGSA